MGQSDPDEIDGQTAHADADERTRKQGLPDEEWLLDVAHEYDTIDRDLARLAMTVTRTPIEVGVIWRLQLPRGERVEAWEPGNNGLAPPAEVGALIERVVAEKRLVPMPPPSTDPGKRRLHEMLELQAAELLMHDPGTRLGTDPENLHEHRVAARRARAFLRATRAHTDPEWWRLLDEPLRALGEVTGPVRDLDVLVEHVHEEVEALEEVDRVGAEILVARLESEHKRARQALLHALDGDSYRVLLTRLRIPPRMASEIETVPLRRLARKEFGRLSKAIGGLGDRPTGGTLHSLRIRLKRARYASELSAPRGRDGKRFLAAARALQTLLGEHQDAVVAEERLRAITVVDPQTAAAFVAGRIAERQRARRERIGDRLPVAWKRLRKRGERLR